jgi:hypothetical protein
MAAKSSIAGVLIGRAGPSWRYMRLGFFHGWRTVRGVPAIRGERLERIGAFAGFDELIDRNLDLGPTTWRQSGYWTEIRQLRYGWCRRRRRRGPPPAIPGMPRNCRLSCCGTKVRIHLPPAKGHTNSIIGWSYLGARRSNRKLVRHASPRIYSSFSKPVLCPRLFAILTQPKVILELTTIHRLLSIFTSPRRPRTSAQDRCSEPTTFDLGWLLLL